MSDFVRVDAWLWAVRVFKTRSAATAGCRAGHVRVSGDRAKAAQPVRVGDEVRIRIHGFDRILTVQKLIVKRVSAAEAAECFTDLTPPPLPREAMPIAPRRDRGAGRPTKRDRRELEKLRGRFSTPLDEALLNSAPHNSAPHNSAPHNSAPHNSAPLNKAPLNRDDE